jgi:hypothetical protein
MKNKRSDWLALTFSILFVILLIISGYKPIKNQPKKLSTLSPSPTVVVLKATTNTYYRSTSPNAPLFSIVIPQGAEYSQDGEPLHINMESGLSVTVCSTCQLFINGCGGPEECITNNVNLGNDVTIGSYYIPLNPSKILGYYENYKNNEGGIIGVRATTDDFRKLTNSDKAALYTIISNLK